MSKVCWELSEKEYLASSFYLVCNWNLVRQISFKFKSTTKSKGVCEVVVAKAIAKGILVSCKGEGSSDFAKAEVQVEKESRWTCCKDRYNENDDNY